MYLFRAVDSYGQTVDFYLSETRDREAAKLFLRKALANEDNQAPHVFARDGLRSYPAALRELQAEGHVERRCRQRVRPYCNNRIEIVFTQMTKPNLLAVQMGGDYVTDLDFAIGHKDA